jgi:GNAT superfamily N-acetyltransferase
MDQGIESTTPPLPALNVLVDAADAGLHPWVQAHVSADARRAALAEELAFCLDTASRDMAHATSFAAAAPQIGEPPEAYLNRWLELGTGGHILAGPRYLGMNPELPFVGVVAADRRLTPADHGALREVAAHHFAAFKPGFVMVTTADPVGTWPGTHPELRQVVGRLGDLRQRTTPAHLTATRRTDVDFYDRYQAIHQRHVDREPQHARHTRCETRDDLQALADRGTLFDVRVDEKWAGVLAAEPGVHSGIRGFIVVELLIDEAYRGQGYGRHLSTLLAKALPGDDDLFLIGTIHRHNTAAYHAALSAGRIDVGGEIVIPL